jgi:predicted PurR-regulated permease PerM
MKMKANKIKRRFASASLIIIWVLVVCLCVKFFNATILSIMTATVVSMICHYHYEKWEWFSITYY